MLLALLATGYGRIDPEGAALLGDAVGFGVSALGRAAPRPASMFAASPSPFVVILDDLHELRSPDCHDVLEVVLSRIPSGSQVVTSSRHEQPHLRRLRGRGDALELVAADLALDAQGAQQIFAELEISLTSEAATEVTERTEGWPVGLYLAAVIAKENDGQLAAVTGDDRYVTDYLYRESLVQLPADVQRFLRRTAVLDQLHGPLCDAILETTGASAQLRQLEASSLFVIPLDRRRDWYRYHALFREFLRGELRRAEPDIIAKLHLRAADWYESNAMPALALEHLLSTPERQRSAQLAAELALSTYNAGRMSTLQRWLNVLGDDAVEAYPPRGVGGLGECVDGRHYRSRTLGRTCRHRVVQRSAARRNRVLRVRPSHAARSPLCERSRDHAGRRIVRGRAGTVVESVARHRALGARCQIRRDEATLASRLKSRPTQPGDDVLPDKAIEKQEREWQDKTMYLRGSLAALKAEAASERRLLESYITKAR